MLTIVGCGCAKGFVAGVGVGAEMAKVSKRSTTFD
jgi:hypothetical protein